ncbi:hypothetical protein BJ085DRAFT_13857 [Dimargaris cristalligena]|uniref:ABC1 atypical kinase-like domain-containing protein n=1 Tax=Dimargaris cristalligena TaxID=215637 RepID=A0A4P9ZWG1_9FUNG|nr:hypothetical protein BJ085DRAFT_13857 [Dimargaris cristalligena]|eukprot:RKP37020.1 hypothetical protein BJ085DRAFT_13857 [Dimargaris cristalligena]
MNFPTKSRHRLWATVVIGVTSAVTGWFYYHRLSTSLVHCDTPAPEVLSPAIDLSVATAQPPPAHWLTRSVQRLFSWLDHYLLEPLKITLRVFQLAFLFLPLVVTFPLGCLGEPLIDRHGETAWRLWWYQFLTQQMARAGPTFIKLSQWAASRSDLFPQEFCRALSRLHSQSTPHSFRQTRRIVERAFGGHRLEDIFEEFDPEPLGTGAIAQVYRARFQPQISRAMLARSRASTTIPSQPDGGERPVLGDVAIKVLHPRVGKLIQRDLAIIGSMAWLLDWIPTIQWLSLRDEVAQFGEMMRSQLDLRAEATNMLRFRRQFRDRPSTVFPHAWPELCTRDVLVETFENAISLSVFLHNRGTDFDKRIAGMGLDAFLKMVIYDNFIHADLHPGNILVTFTQPLRHRWYDRSTAMTSFHSTSATRPEYLSHPQAQSQINQTLQGLAAHPNEFHEYLNTLSHLGYVPQLVFLDTGLIATLNETNRRNFLDLFQAIAQFDGYRTGQLMVERCRTPQLVIDPDIFALKMQHLILQVRHKTLKLSQVSIGDLLHQVMTMVRQHHVKLEGDFVNVVISILILEGIGRQLDPELDLLKVALPILRNYGMEQGRKAATLGGVKPAPPSGLQDLAWWFKVWVWLEAREWVSEVRRYEVENGLFGELLYPDV